MFLENKKKNDSFIHCTTEKISEIMRIKGNVGKMRSGRRDR